MRMSTPANDQLFTEHFFALAIRLIRADLRRRAGPIEGLPLFDFRNRRLAMAGRRLKSDVERGRSAGGIKIVRDQALLREGALHEGPTQTQNGCYSDHERNLGEHRRASC